MENKKALPEGSTLNRQENCTPSRSKTQEEKLFDAWERGEEVSQLEGILFLGIGHLSSVISKMVHTEHITGIRKIPRTSRSGAKYMAYYMSKEDLKKARETYSDYKRRRYKHGN